MNAARGCGQGRTRARFCWEACGMSETPSGHLGARGAPAEPDWDPRWRRTLYTMWLAMFFVCLEWTFALTFLPVFLQKDIGLTFEAAEFWMGLLIAGPSLAMFLAQPLWGLYSDRVGRKRIVIVGVVFTSLLRASWYWADGPWALLLLSMGAGLLGAGVITADALVASATPRERIGEAMGTMQTAMTAGFLVGPVIGQACAGWIGPRPTFLMQALFALVGAVTVWLLVQERFVPPAVLERFTVRAIGRDLRPLIGNRQLQALWVMLLVVFFGFSSMWPIMTYFVQYLGVAMDRVAAYAAYIMLVSGLLQTFLSPLFGRVGDRVGHKVVLLTATFACGVFLIPHYFVQSYAQFFVLRMLATAPSAAIYPTTAALAAAQMPRSRYGGTYGVLVSANTLAASVGPIVGGVLAAFVGIRWVYVWTGIWTLAAAVWGWRVVTGTPEQPQEGDEVGAMVGERSD